MLCLDCQGLVWQKIWIKIWVVCIYFNQGIQQKTTMTVSKTLLIFASIRVFGAHKVKCLYIYIPTLRDLMIDVFPKAPQTKTYPAKLITLCLLYTADLPAWSQRSLTSHTHYYNTITLAVPFHSQADMNTWCELQLQLTPTCQH